jgi:hypothetical protein
METLKMKMSDFDPELEDAFINTQDKQQKRLQEEEDFVFALSLSEFKSESKIQKVAPPYSPDFAKQTPKCSKCCVFGGWSSPLNQNGICHVCSLRKPLPSPVTRETKAKTKHKSKKSSPRFSKPGSCFRCGRESHYSPDCYAKTDIYGAYLN